MSDQLNPAQDILGAYAEANAPRSRRVQPVDRSVLTWFELAIGLAVVALAVLVFTAVNTMQDGIADLRKDNTELRQEMVERDRVNGENICRLIAAPGTLGPCSPPDKS